MMRLTTVAAVAALLVGAPLAAAGLPAAAQTAPNVFQQPPKSAEIRGGLWVISAGSNAVLAVGQDGAILVDSLMFNPDKLAAAVSAITPLPVKYVVSTHAHRDHTGGNATFAKLGAVVVSTAKAAKEISEPSVNGRGETQPPIDKEGWPTRTYAARTTISVAGQSLQFIPVPPAHTDGDAIVYFPKANVLVMGDLHHSHEYPVYDPPTGSFQGNLDAYRKALKIADAKTVIVPGHGGLTNKAEVTAYLAMLEGVRGKVKAMIAEGKTKEEVVAAKPLAGDTSLQPGGPNNADNFVGVLYTALKSGVGD